VEYRLRSFLPWPAGILLDAIAGGDVFRDPAHAVFIISKKSFCTKPTVISSFSTTALFQLKPTVRVGYRSDGAHKSKLKVLLVILKVLLPDRRFVTVPM
jgi:hypothetical protein